MLFVWTNESHILYIDESPLSKSMFPSRSIQAPFRLLQINITNPTITIQT
uniref:Uncharacterized protein n=1 Tax=Lepeophtheirus salmonis TaxID=72036 RepID=A0A0K2SWY3_LEPSM